MDSSIAPKGEGVLTLRGVDISYEILGKSAAGVPIVLTPGGGGGKAGLRWLAQRLRGSRQCLIWDRPNCGASGLTLGDDLLQPEPDLQADFLHELLHNLGMAPAILLGKSNGARLSLILASKYPEDVAALVLLNVTNGTKAAKRLSQERYYKSLDACAQGGLEAVAELPHYKELFVKNSANRTRLLAFEPARFMTQMKVWGDFLARAGDATRFPVTGLEVALLQRVTHPALCVYVMDEGGKDDGMHTLSAMRALHACLPGAAGREVVVTHDKDVYSREIDAFAAAVPLATSVPPSPSFAQRQAKLAARPGFYPHTPNAAELKQFEDYYARVAAENAAEAERERNALCSCSGVRGWLPSTWRTNR